jgi:UDP-N-acetylmuramoylalanine--D-glutamate ligase
MYDVQGKKVTVVGLGRTAIALAKLLQAKGANPFVTDNRSEEQLGNLPKALRDAGIPYETNGHTAEAFANAAFVIPSPGVSPNIPPIAEAKANGAQVIGEMEFASTYCTAPIAAVTGTNGKTTTTTLLYELMKACGVNAVLAGNNDVPLSQVALENPNPEAIVLEVSSYQLETTKSFHPQFAVVLNVSNDHLARHGTIENYAAAKARIFANQCGEDVAVINADDPRCAAMAENIKARVVPFSQIEPPENGIGIVNDRILWQREPVASTNDIPLPGRHNRENVLAALAVMRAGAFDWPRAIEGLRAFKGVEHRIEFVQTVHGVHYYNDSKSTNLDSLRVALESFDNPVLLLAGGEGKGADYRELTELVRQKVQALFAYGQDAATIAAAYHDIVPVTQFTTLTEAAEAAAAHAKPGDTVLLSPACASFDQFANFEERGRVFKRWVTQHAGAVTT